ncbi:hypothetical protein C8N37_103344 [Sphingobacterium faecium]|nr:hypothetical protein C8N37_103344 [Sphingobacterium faecium]
MKNYILVYLIAAYLVFPILITSDYWYRIYMGDYTYYSTRYASSIEYWNVIRPNFLVAGSLFLIVSLLPFHFIEKYLITTKEIVNFWIRSILFVIYNILVIVITGYGGILTLQLSEGNIPVWLNIIFWSMCIRLIFKVFSADLKYSIIEYE